MAERPVPETSAEVQETDAAGLLRWLTSQRWFGSKGQVASGVELVEEAQVAPGVTLAFAQVQFATGAHDLYQLVLAPGSDGAGFDVLPAPAPATALLAAIAGSRELEGRHGRFSFRLVGADGVPAGLEPGAEVRMMGAEQSNSSVVFGERIVLKLFRRLEPGINPDLEMHRFLTAHDYPNIAPLHGWYEYEGDALAATLGLAQRFVSGGADGWELALEQIQQDPELLLERIAALGSVTARLHTVLASDPDDPAFSPQDPSTEFLNIMRATLDDQLERIFGELPDHPGLAPLAGLEQQVRECITLPPQGPIGGKSIRIHGDYHLGQTLYTGAGWTLLDFEGEPARPLNARRQKRSPLRDVASMLRSFAYAGWVLRLRCGVEPPADFEQRARSAFLEAYLDGVERVLLPASQAHVISLLAAFELEKLLYELRYELEHRPAWLPIPVAGVLRLLESG